MNSYNERRKMMKRYNALQNKIKVELKWAVKYNAENMNPVRLYYIVRYSLENDEEISEYYHVPIAIVKKIRNR